MSRLPQAATDAIIPALLLDIIGDPATNPKGWPFRVLSHVADIGSGLTKGRKLNGQETIATPYLRVANVQDGYLDLAEIKTIEATAADLEKCAFRAGDILMTEGGDADKLGRCAIWRDVVDGCLHQNHIFRVRVGPHLLPDYTRPSFKATRESHTSCGSRNERRGLLQLTRRN